MLKPIVRAIVLLLAGAYLASWLPAPPPRPVYAQGSLPAVNTAASVWTTTLGASVGVAAITSAPAIANTETVITSYTAAANTLVAGTSFRVSAFMTRAGTNAATPVYRVRVGPTTLTGNIAATLTGIAEASGPLPRVIHGLVTVRSAGAGGTVIGGMVEAGNTAATTGVATGTVAVDTTVQNLVELTLISGHASNTYTVQTALIERVRL